MSDEETLYMYFDTTDSILKFKFHWPVYKKKVLQSLSLVDN